MATPAGRAEVVMADEVRQAVVPQTGEPVLQTGDVVLQTGDEALHREGAVLHVNQ